MGNLVSYAPDGEGEDLARLIVENLGAARYSCPMPPTWSSQL